MLRGGRRALHLQVEHDLQGESWPTAAVPVDSPYCSCKLTLVLTSIKAVLEGGKVMNAKVPLTQLLFISEPEPITVAAEEASYAEVCGGRPMGLVKVVFGTKMSKMQSMMVRPCLSLTFRCLFAAFP